MTARRLPPRTARHPGQRFGRAGRPLNRQSPFYVGFVGALGVSSPSGSGTTLGRLTVITLLVVSLFLTLAINPLVESLTNRGSTGPAPSPSCSPASSRSSSCSGSWWCRR